MKSDLIVYIDLQYERGIKISSIIRQCAYDITLRLFRATIVAVENHEVANLVSVCMYSCLGSPACKAHASYLLYEAFVNSAVFFHIISYGGKKVIGLGICILLFCSTYH
jgi:hypothetical protein